MATASATTQSANCASIFAKKGDFPRGVSRKSPIGGHVCRRLVSDTLRAQSRGDFGAEFSGAENPFPGNGDCCY